MRGGFHILSHNQEKIDTNQGDMIVKALFSSNMKTNI